MLSGGSFRLLLPLPPLLCILGTPRGWSGWSGGRAGSKERRLPPLECLGLEVRKSEAKQSETMDQRLETVGLRLEAKDQRAEASDRRQQIEVTREHRADTTE